MPEWTIKCNVDDAVAITIGRTVAPHGDLAADEECRMAFAAALPQFMARAVAGRYSAALDARAQVRANDLASAVVVEYPEGYNPQVTDVPLNVPTGPGPEFTTGPVADPVTEPPVVVEADLSGGGDLAGDLAVAPSD